MTGESRQAWFSGRRGQRDLNQKAISRLAYLAVISQAASNCDQIKE
jgi:hypothetical protein